MTPYLYLSLLPESLIASMLSPDRFGAYYATGSQGRNRGRAAFFEVDRAKLDPADFQLDQIDARCAPHKDGRPRKSTYISIYRVLEHVPLDALGPLHLVTDDGRTLSLQPQPFEPEPGPRSALHLYQELCPVQPLVASLDNPLDFCERLTDRSQMISVDALAFCELRLNGLATHPGTALTDDLPYPNLHHLRDCLLQLEANPEKRSKIVVRGMSRGFLYRTVKSGFFVGRGRRLLHYPMPRREALERDHYEWWRSAEGTLG